MTLLKETGRNCVDVWPRYLMQDGKSDDVWRQFVSVLGGDAVAKDTTPSDEHPILAVSPLLEESLSP
ncbi:hypothetical protein RR48_01238 [Papilio machaon]|uniref:Uncharacterized protein n=1 Tax=Papilio machaon TaxID=76193 RepID=A0A0N0PFT2_PAPMA|nr:hypothetical protein RR48_01238 [Papilio machaon]